MTLYRRTRHKHTYETKQYYTKKNNTHILPKRHNDWFTI